MISTPPAFKAAIVASTSSSARSADGYEITFATNHLGHYLLLRLLMPRLADDANVIITTSGTHDPADQTSFPPPRHADGWLLAYPRTGFRRRPLVARGGWPRLLRRIEAGEPAHRPPAGAVGRGRGTWMDDLRLLPRAGAGHGPRS
ncbi:hypothetical protein [Mesorhizobium delmotii]|uniref:hypothetical protein n=1 Tax=Mesorhizobium delmotii TaxID=1631247 RepID=UPI001403CD6B|nr:hypothetical protein [Mesorhizobium delmotii]